MPHLLFDDCPRGAGVAALGDLGGAVGKAMLAESSPGAYRNPGSIDPWAAALIGALLRTWVTFVPCFLLIFLGAPYVERLRGNKNLTAALTGITAAAVGVIANLAVYFALHTVFAETTCDVRRGDRCNSSFRNSRRCARSPSRSLSPPP